MRVGLITPNYPLGISHPIPSPLFLIVHIICCTATHITDFRTHTRCYPQM